MVLEELVLENYDPNSPQRQDDAILNAKVRRHPEGGRVCRKQYNRFCFVLSGGGGKRRNPRPRKRFGDFPTPWFACTQPGLLARTLVRLYGSHDAHTLRLICACGVRWWLLASACYVFERKCIEPCCMSLLAVEAILSRAQAV